MLHRQFRVIDFLFRANIENYYLLLANYTNKIVICRDSDALRLNSWVFQVDRGVVTINLVKG
jgi:hypothetical protein